MQITTFIATVLVLICPASASFARTWTDRTGKHSVEAELLAANETEVTLKKSEGKTVTLQLSRLSDADQRFIKALLANPDFLLSGKIVRVDAQHNSFTAAPQNAAIPEQVFNLSGNDQILLERQPTTLASLKPEEPVSIYTVGKQLIVHAGSDARSLKVSKAKSPVSVHTRRPAAPRGGGFGGGGLGNIFPQESRAPNIAATLTLTASENFTNLTDFAGKWACRVRDAEASSSMQSGQFILALQDGRPTYLPLSNLRDVPDAPLPYGLLLTRKPLSEYPSIKSILYGGLDKPPESRLAGGNHGSVADLHSPRGEKTDARYVQLTDSNVHYLKVSDPKLSQNTTAANGSRSRTAPETRVMDATDGLWIIPTGIPARMDYVETEKKWYFTLFWIQSVGSELRPPALEARFTCDFGADSELRKSNAINVQSPYVRDVFPDGSVLVVANFDPTDRWPTDDKSPLNRRILLAPGSVKFIHSSDGISFSYNRKLRAFVHSNNALLPITVTDLHKLTASRLDDYRKVASLILLPRCIAIPRYAELTSNQRLDFEAAVTKANRSGVAESAAQTWSELSALNVEEQLAYMYTHHVVWKPFRDAVVENTTSHGKERPSWDRMSPEEQVATHRSILANERRLDARNRSDAKIMAIGLAVFGVKMLHDASAVPQSGAQVARKIGMGSLKKPRGVGTS